MAAMAGPTPTTTTRRRRNLQWIPASASASQGGGVICDPPPTTNNNIVFLDPPQQQTTIIYKYKKSMRKKIRHTRKSDELVAVRPNAHSTDFPIVLGFLVWGRQTRDARTKTMGTGCSSLLCLDLFFAANFLLGSWGTVLCYVVFCTGCCLICANVLIQCCVMLSSTLDLLLDAVWYVLMCWKWETCKHLKARTWENNIMEAKPCENHHDT